MPAFQTIRIACGQSSAVTDSDGNLWSADEDFTGGTGLVTKGQAVAGTSSSVLYDGQRYGDNGAAFRYVVPVPAGHYAVRLKFAEGYYTTGGRVFDVSINGASVLQNFDIYAASGALWTAVDRTFTVTVGSAGNITLEWNPVVSDPKVDAIEIAEAATLDGGVAVEAGPSPTPDAATPPKEAGSGGSTDLVGYLKGLNTGTSKRVLSGQHANYWQQSNSNAYGEQLDEFTGSTPANVTITTTGKTPAILGTTFDLQYQNVTSSQNVALANGWLATGGIVQVSYWPINPAGGSTNPFPDILTSSTATNTAWLAELASLANQLKELSGPVLFRPLLELNGNWFWWGAENRTSAQFVQLWQQMHDYLVAAGVKNLVWVYCVNAGTGNYTEPYPGSTYVDVVAFDYYGDNPSTDPVSTYEALETLDKPIIIAEAGVGGPTTQPPDSGDNSQFIDAVKTAMPNIVAIVIWGQGWALNQQNGASAFMTDPWIIDRTDLPSGL